MSIRNLVAAIALAAVAPIASAQVYVGASGGISNWSVDCGGTTSCDKNGTGLKGFIGYRLSGPFAVEALYVDLGKTTARVGMVDVAIKGQGVGAALVLDGKSDKWSYGARLGAVSMKGKVSVSGGFSGSSAKTSTQALFGIFAGYEIVDNLSLRLELDSTRVQTEDGSEGTVRLIGAGLTYRF